ncbi:LysR family transcriptional regulator [Rhodobacter capsulatus]|uniref:LysR family transcriptional regulator n=1 Tax=Rhodobacter capsulatus TaxID=1061 RepID=UPI0040290F02
MRSSSLILAEAALRLGSVRLAARESRQPSSTCSLALRRLEEELSVTLARRNTDGLALTLEGRRALPGLARLAAGLRALQGCGPEAVPARPLTLETLFRVAEALRAGSIRTAARQLGIGQPQLSRQLALVENVLGQGLAGRSDAGLVTTPEGHLFEAQVAALQADWRALCDPGQGAAPVRARAPVSIGTVLPATPDGDLARMLGGLIRRLTESHALNFTLVATLAEDLLTGLDTGRFDCVFLDARLRDRYYSQIELRRSQVALCGLPEGLVRAGAMIEPAVLRKLLETHPLVLQSRRSGLRQRAEAFFDAHLGPDWRGAARVLEIDALPIIVNVLAGDGYVSVLPEHVGRTNFGGRHVILPDAYDQRLMLTWRQSGRARRIAELIAGDLAEN